MFSPLKIYYLKIFMTCPHCGRQMKERFFIHHFGEEKLLFDTSAEMCPKCGGWCSRERMNIKEVAINERKEEKGQKKPD